MASTAQLNIFCQGDTPLKLIVDTVATNGFTIRQKIVKAGGALCYNLEDAAYIIVDRFTKEANERFSACRDYPDKHIVTPAWVKACVNEGRLIGGADMDQYKITGLVALENYDEHEDEDMEDEALVEGSDILSNIGDSHLPTPPASVLGASHGEADLPNASGGNFFTNLPSSALAPATQPPSLSLPATTMLTNLGPLSFPQSQSSHLSTPSSSSTYPKVALTSSQPYSPLSTTTTYTALVRKPSLASSHHQTAGPSQIPPESPGKGMAAASVAPKVHFTLQLLFTFADGSLMKFWVHMDIKAHRELSELIRKNGGQTMTTIKDASFALFNNNGPSFRALLPDAIANKIPPLRTSFIQSCIDKGQILDWHDFVVKNTPPEDEARGFWKKSEESLSRLLFSKYGEDLDEETVAKVCHILNKRFPHRHPRYFVAYQNGSAQGDTVQSTSSPVKSPERKYTSKDKGKSRERISSPPPVIGAPILIAADRYLFTPEENTYALSYIKVLVQRDPEITIANMAEMLEMKLPHHSVASWSAHLRKGKLDEISEIQRQYRSLAAIPKHLPTTNDFQPSVPKPKPNRTSLPARQSPTPPSELPTSSSSGFRYTADEKSFALEYVDVLLERDPSATFKSLAEALHIKAPHHPATGWRVYLQEKVRDEVDAMRRNHVFGLHDDVLGRDPVEKKGSTSSGLAEVDEDLPPFGDPFKSPKANNKDKARAHERIASPTPVTSAPVLSSVDGKYLFTEEEAAFALVYIRVLIQRDLGLSEKALARALEKKLPHHSTDSWRNYIKRKLDDDVERIRLEFVDSPRTATKPTSLSTDIARPKKKKKRPFIRLWSSLPEGLDKLPRSPTPPSTPRPSAHMGYTFTEDERAYTLKYVEILLQRTPDMSTKALAHTLHAKMRHRSAESWRGLLRRYLQDELKGFRQKYLALPRKPTPDPIIQSTVANADVETTSTSALVAPTLHSDEDSDSSWNDDSSDSDWEVDSSPSAPLEERTSPPAWTSTKSNPISYTNDDFQRVAEFLAQDLDDVSYRQKWAAFEVKYPSHTARAWAEFYRSRKDVINPKIEAIRRERASRDLGSGSQKRRLDSDDVDTTLTPDKRPKLMQREIEVIEILSD